jgi:hypothetical protein
MSLHYTAKQSMVDNKHAQLSQNVFQHQYTSANGQQPQRGVRQDKIAPERDRAASVQPASLKKMTRTRQMGINISRPQKYSKKRSTKRQTVPMTIWGSPDEKRQLQQLADSEGLSLSQTGRAIIVDGIRQRLRIEREVLATPILEAFFDKKMNRLINRLSEFLARSVYEGGQLRWLFINKLYWEVINPEKKLTKEEFYKLLDTSQKETIKSVKRWNPNIQDVVEAIKNWLKEREET